MFVPGAQVVGLGLMGFGVGSILGGHISMANGGTFAGGWLFGGLFGGTLGTVAGMALPAVTSFLGTSFSFAVPTLSLTGGGLAIGSTAISVSGSTLAKGIIGSLIMFSKGAKRFNPKDDRNNKTQNEEFNRIANEFNLNRDQRQRLHNRISKKGYNADKIIEMIKILFPKIFK